MADTFAPACGPARAGAQRAPRSRSLPGSVMMYALALAALAAISSCTGSADTSASANGMVDTLRNMLPTGEVVEIPPETGSPSARNFGVFHDDGDGAVRIVVSLQRVGAVEDSELARCPLISQSPTSRCTREIRADGSILVLNQAYEKATAVGVQRWTAVTTSTDGRQIVVSEWNRASEDAAVPSRPAPSLSLRQLSAIATSPKWDPAFAEISAPAPLPNRSKNLMREREMLAIAKTLLPKRLRSAHEEGHPRGYVDLTMRDGKGDSLLEIQLQRWRPGDPSMANVFANSVAKANGVRLRFDKGKSRHGGAGVVSWSADVLYPDGLRVVATEMNAPAYGLDAVRDEPAMTVDELTALALSPLWTRHT